MTSCRRVTALVHEGIIERCSASRDGVYYIFKALESDSRLITETFWTSGSSGTVTRLIPM